MFGIGSTELVIILVFGFLLFGPDKLPQMGRTIGRALRQFRETQEKLTAVVQTEVVDPMAAAAKKPVVVDDAPSAQGDDDADAPSAASEPVRKETFAERRARLAAERAEAAKAAAESEAAAKAPAADDAEGASSESVAVQEPAATEEPGDVAAAEPVAEEPVALTTEDLYARRPRKRKVAQDDTVEPEASADAAPGDSQKGGEQ